MSLPPIPEKLKEAIKDGSLVLFVGAGFSQQLGLPNWKNLVVELINQAATQKPELKDLTQPYQSGIIPTLTVLDILSPYKGVILDCLEQIFDKNIDFGKVPLSLHKKLWQISTQIITTNYDKALEKANDKADWFDHDTTNKVRKLGELRDYVFKIHGDISDSGKCILFRSDYDKLYTDKSAAIFELKATFAHKTILFIGFSMTDPYVKYVADYMSDLFNGLNNRHYILNVQDNDFLKEGIIPIKLNDWSELEPFLNELAEIRHNSKSHTPATEVEKVVTISIEPTPVINTLNDYPKADFKLFTGRDDEKLLFQQALKEYPLFAVEGLGGVGKTEFVAACVEEYITDKQRIIWLDGNENSKFDVFVQSAGYGNVLQQSESKKQEAIFAGIKDLIERDNRIIFWDNYQKITDPRFAEFVNFAQQYLRQSTIVFIAKKGVYVKGSSIFTVPIKGLEEKAFVFAKKLRDSEPRFAQITDADLNSLCNNTLGHPLAIKLSLPLLAKGLSVTKLFAHIDQYKDLPQVEELTKRIFTEVYDHTTSDEKYLLQNFSIFNQKVPLTAIEHIYGKDNSFNTLYLLIDKFLISFDGEFYESHPLVRELSNNRLAEKEPVHALAAEYYLKQRGDQLSPALEERIYYHLAQSKQWQILEKEIEDRGRRYILLGQLGLVQELIDSLKKAGFDKPIFNIFYGDIAEVLGRWKEAKEFYEQAAGQQDDRRVKAEGMIKVGEMFYRRGQIKEALVYFETAYSYSKENNYRIEEARALNDIGLVRDVLGETKTAESKHWEALAIREEQNDQEGIATSLLNIGCILRDTGKYSGALTKLSESLNISYTINDKKGISNSLSHIGTLFNLQGNEEGALQKFQESLKIDEEIGNKQGISACLTNIGSIFQDHNKHSEALAQFEKSLAIDLEIGDQKGRAASLTYIGATLKEQGQYKEALGKTFEGLDFYEEIGDKTGQAASLAAIADILNAQNKYSEALKYEKLSIEIFIETGHKREIYIGYYNMANIYGNGKFKDYKNALRCLFKALKELSSLEIEDHDPIRRIKEIRDEKLGREKFKVLAYEVYDEMDTESKLLIPIHELCKEGLKLTPPTSKNAPCPCGSGKQYKRCHGKES